MSDDREATPVAFRLRPSPMVASVPAYRVPRAAAPVDLRLDGNEGAPPPRELLSDLAGASSEILRRYPSPRPIEEALAARLGVARERVIATAGGDDALERACRVALGPGRELVLPVPTFEMLERFARMAGGEVVQVLWRSARYPTDAVLEALTPHTAAIAVVSPNNPTGAIATAADLRRLATAAPQALLLVDLAYVEFADDDLTAAALALPNAVVFRTLSKAWGMAGLRVGYAVGPADVIAWMRRVGLPYAISGPSVALATARLAAGDEAIQPFLSRVRAERVGLAQTLSDCGAVPAPGAANFVFARHPDPSWIRDALAGLGIGVRVFPNRPERDGLSDALRVSCPGDDAALARVQHALSAALRPEALLLDADGVVVDVSASYREAVIQTAAHFGVTVTPADVARAKAAGGANDDWELTRVLLADRHVNIPLAEVIARFEALYQGEKAGGVEPSRPGLRERERLLPARATLEKLAARLPLALVTGRPRADAERLIEAHELDGIFRVVVCREDAPLKPDPEPVRLALERLGVTRAWMVGDSPDDVRAARAAGVVPLGIVAPGDDVGTADALTAAGAGRILTGLDALLTTLDRIAPGRSGREEFFSEKERS